MDPQLLDQYRGRILPRVEEPIREIVNALWELPFVVDTNESCSGHIVTDDRMKSLGRYERIRHGLYWYPHGIRLGIDFSLEDGLRKSGESFREDVSAIDVDIKLKSSAFKRVYRTVEGTTTEVLHLWYNSDFPDRNLVPPQTRIDEYIKETHDRLIAFWEAFAQVVRKYNPEATISPVSGKNFLKIMNWADLGDPSRYIFH